MESRTKSDMGDLNEQLIGFRLDDVDVCIHIIRSWILVWLMSL